MVGLSPSWVRKGYEIATCICFLSAAHTVLMNIKGKDWLTRNLDNEYHHLIKMQLFLTILWMQKCLLALNTHSFTHWNS